MINIIRSEIELSRFATGHEKHEKLEDFSFFFIEHHTNNMIVTCAICCLAHMLDLHNLFSVIIHDFVH